MTETSNDRILDSGDRVLIITRRLFSDDVQRHFVGLVDRVAANAVLVHGYAFVHDVGQGKLVRRKNQRSRVFCLDNYITIFVLPDDVEIQDVRYEQHEDGQLVVTDGKEFRIDLSEFST